MCASPSLQPTALTAVKNWTWIHTNILFAEKTEYVQLEFEAFLSHSKDFQVSHTKTHMLLQNTEATLEE